MKCLVIVESAAKAKTISKYLESLYPDRTWTVTACFGHVRDLPTKTIGVDPDTWDVTWEILPTKKDTVSKLKKLAKEATTVYLASDPDLEGYAIAHHLQIVLAVPMKKCVRVTFNEITKAALKAAFDVPSGWNDAKVAAQETRRILDRIVGYQVSPLLWKVFAGSGASGLSAGRVQSAALAMVQKRFGEFTTHDPQNTWVLQGKFDDNGLCLEAKADTEIADLVLAKEHVHKVLEHGAGSLWNVVYSTKITKKSPPPPFTTSSLQQEAYTCHRFPPKMTMSLAQALYEEGLITYMRTDSNSLSEDAVIAIKAHVTVEFGEAWVGAGGGTKKQAVAPNAQEAHEAVRPTDVTATVVEFKSPAHAKLYNLIWRRAVASQMAPAKYLEIRYDVSMDNPELRSYIFHGKTALLTSAGFLRVYSPASNVDGAMISMWENAIASAAPRATMMQLIAECEVSRPKLLYTETDLIKAMEKNGIGRPSTYVSIIEKLLSKGYVVKDMGPVKTVDLTNIVWCRELGATRSIMSHEEHRSAKIGGSDSDRMVPLELGQKILTYLQTTLPDLLDVTFTATMEHNLDRIEQNQVDKLTVLNQFYTPFHATVTAAMGAVTGAAGMTSINKSKNGRRTDFAPFLKWRGVATISEADREVLEQLPQNVLDGGDKVVFGPYGVYIKTKAGKNKRLDKSKWNKVITKTVTSEDY